MSAPVACSPHSGQEDQLGEGVGRNILDIVGLEVDVLEARKETHRCDLLYFVPRHVHGVEIKALL